MKQIHINYIIIIIVTLILCALFLFSIRYEVNKTNVYSIECLVRTNLLTGKSCLIGGKYECDDFYDTLEFCHNVKD